MNDFARFKNPVVHLERTFSFVKNILTEEKYRRTDNIAKNFLFTGWCKFRQVKYQQQTSEIISEKIYSQKY